VSARASQGEDWTLTLLDNRHEATAAIWQEVYLSAILRSILYADDPDYR
jgi:hypothetical protein